MSISTKSSSGRPVRPIEPDAAAVGGLEFEKREHWNMLHVDIKAMAGRSEKQKTRLAQAIARDVVEILECDEASVSVAFEELASGRWNDEVYLPDIQG